ncbi:hypothetical protein [Parvibaculum sp.]|uniref:hypothetical protein n=1 Tax=Parvibaculum sp. TaxID=2024848 RepID=UPI001E179794|nr:hypothetical protein [Parvibaculum sp.]MBX3490859.1 hypothetical protein [Parvibaculum sp.]
MTDAALAEREPRIGDNNPPDEFVTLKDEVDKYLKTADLWIAERPEFVDSEMAAKAQDMLNQLAALAQKADGMAEAEKRPLMDRLAEVRKRFASLTDRINDAKTLLNARKKAWLDKESARIAKEKADAEERARAALEEAQKKAREAEELAAKAAAGDLKSSGVSVTGAMAEAREAEELAAKAAAGFKAASSQKASVRGDQTGGKATGLKTFYVGEIVDNGKLLAWVKKNRPDELMGFLQKYADTYARSPELRKTGLPGVEFKAEQRL